MSNPSSLRSRIGGTAFAAAMVAIMAAGPGTLLVTPAVRLTEPVVCGEGERIEYRFVRYGHQGPGESSLEVACVGRAGGEPRDVVLPAMATLAGIYFAVLFPVLLFWPRTPTDPRTARAEARARARRERAGAAGGS